MPYRINHKAEDDLADIYWFGVARFGRRQAEAYYQQLIRRFDDIASDPLLWPEVNHIRAGYRRSVMGSHSVYYRLRSTQVEIMRILGRQAWDA